VSRWATTQPSPVRAAVSRGNETQDRKCALVGGGPLLSGFPPTLARFLLQDLERGAELTLKLGLLRRVESIEHVMQAIA
jgi:hypothetical protein